MYSGLFFFVVLLKHILSSTFDSTYLTLIRLFIFIEINYISRRYSYIHTSWHPYMIIYVRPLNFKTTTSVSSNDQSLHYILSGRTWRLEKYSYEGEFSGGFLHYIFKENSIIILLFCFVNNLNNSKFNYLIVNSSVI